MSDIQRFTLETKRNSEAHNAIIEFPSDDGEWCKWSDVEERIAALVAENEELKAFKTLRLKSGMLA